MFEDVAISLKIAVEAGTPILLASLGEIYAERSGVLNLGVEGMMMLGAVVGFATTLTTKNPILGVLLASLVAALLSLVHAFACVSLKANQVVSGLALTMLGVGISGVLGRQFVGSPLPVRVAEASIPGLSDIPLIGKALFSHDPFVYLSYALVVILWFVLYKTKLGIEIRAVGEDPSAADAAGVNVALVQYGCVALGGALAGLGGAYLSVVYTPAWIENMTAGRGWIAIALVIFAMWDPLRAVIGAYLFGGLEALQFRLQQALFFGYRIPVTLLGSLPYIATIAVLVFASSEAVRKRIGAPSALGKPYFREERVF